jgi:ketosteroid isomerase-like protein
MENQTLNTVREFLAAVQSGDQAKLAALLHPELTWKQPGNNRLSGTKRSSLEAFQMVGSMYEVSGGTLALAGVKFTGANGNSAACMLRWTAQRSGAVLDVDNVDLYTVENGQITSVTVYSGDIAQEDQFWGK